MATTDLPVQADFERTASRPSGRSGPATAWTVAKRVLAPLASLRLTVVLLAMAVFIVLAGTLAQAEMGIERVVNEFFRVRPWGPTLGFARVPLQVFFPESFFPNPAIETRPVVSGSFWFPGGWLIGLGMFVNLLAAHAVRFTIQTKGTRLLIGLAVLLAGIALTYGVVASGAGAGGLQATPLLSYQSLWRLFQAHVVMLTVAAIGGAIWLHRRPAADRRLAWVVTAATPIAVALAAWALFVPDVGDASMRILWQLIKAGMASLVLLAGCVLLFRKRAGIVLLHAGVGLLMMSELIVGLLAVETQMRLAEGETSSWAQDINSVELAVVDPSNPDHDLLIRFPGSRIEEGAILTHEQIPFRLRVDSYFTNSSLIKASASQRNPSDTGAGRAYVAQPVPEVAGTDTGSGVDQPAAYVTVLDEKSDRKLGTYLLSSLLESSGYVDTVAADGKDWRLSLRFERSYKPYAVTLLDVKKEDYVGTDTPKNYSSDVRVQSAGLEPFERHIWMNNPLRFAGETLYQSGYHREPSGKEITTLQIVKNTGWMLPYVACMIVVFGMAAQFLVTLSRFVGRRLDATSPARNVRRDEAADEAEFESSRAMRRLGWIIPVLAVLVFGGYLTRKFAPARPTPGEADLVAFGEIPVASHGRVKPIDTLARDALKALSNNRQEYKTGVKYGPFEMFERKESATRWLLDLIASPREGAKHRVIRIDNDELRTVMGLADRDDFLYSIGEVFEAREKLAKRLDEARAKSEAKKPLNAADREAFALQEKFGVVDLLFRSFQPDTESLSGGVAGMRSYLDRHEAFKHGDPHATPRPIPSRNPPLAVFYPDLKNRETRIWETLGHAQLMESLLGFAAESQQQTHPVDPPVAAWTSMLDAWNKKDATAFNAAVSKYRSSLEKEPPTDYVPAKVGFEAYFNHAAPFYYLMVPYVVAALLAAGSWLGLTRPLNRAAFWLVVMTFALHTLALVGRIYISGRPPVTNLYSSAVFIGWAAVAFGIVLELVYRLGFGNVMSGVVGFATLLIAHNLSGDGNDTFSVLQAVLDTQFWLATHVVTVTLGYAATYVAGFFGLLYIVLGVATPRLGGKTGSGLRAETIGQALIRMTYGVLCFALLFSFFGTVLGGLWADDSWGRFWGWDPKENGALIIVLWNALVLHARWGAIVKDRGLAMLAVAGNIAVSWSWFGTNQLGVGLHAYGGFAGTVVFALGLFVLSQLAVIAAGSLPKSLWLSFRKEPAAA